MGKTPKICKTDIIGGGKRTCLPHFITGTEGPNVEMLDGDYRAYMGCIFNYPIRLGRLRSLLDIHFSHTKNDKEKITGIYTMFDDSY